MAKILQECIIVSKEVNDKFIIAKNRIRKPLQKRDSKIIYSFCKEKNKKQALIYRKSIC